MNSSGMKRGFAAVAVSALAVAGAPFLAGPASAIPIADTLPANAVSLYVPEGSADISTEDDGTNTSVSLVAGGGASVTSVLFQYSTDAGANWTDIPGGLVARNANGAFQVDWSTVPAPGTSVTLRAVPNTGVANADTFVATVLSAAGGNTVEMATEGSLGVFQSPYTEAGHAGEYVGVTGTVSDGTTEVTTWAASNGLFNQDATVDPASDTFMISYDIAGYPYSPGAEPNQIVLASFTNVPWTEDAEASTLYVQQIGAITATPATQERANPADSVITLKVTDTTGKAVAGAQVGLFDDQGTPATGDDVSTILGYTNAKGEYVDSSQTTAGTFTYYVNLTDNDVYQSGTDKSASATVTTYTPALQTVDIVNNWNRTNFDIDELSDGDEFSIATLDQRGNPIDENLAGSDVEYRWTFAGAQTAWFGGETNAQGVFNVPAPTDALVPGGLPQGDYTLDARRPNVGGVGLTNAAPETFAASESEITYTDGLSANAPINGSYTVTGKLANAKGALAGREIRMHFAPGIDAAFAPQAAQPAGVTVVDADHATFVTGADGAFAVALKDPPVPSNVTPVPETGVLNALAYEAKNHATVLQGNLGPDDPTAANQPANAEQDLSIHFIKAPEVSDVIIDTDALYGSWYGPGRPADLDIVVTGKDGDTNPANDPVLEDFPVTVSVDKGFLSPNAESAGDLTLADGHNAAGDLWGFFKSLGTTADISTGDSAEAGIVAAIERDAAFDADGLDTMVVTVKAGAVTKTVTLALDATAPINSPEISLERVAGEPTGDVVVGKDLEFNLWVKDQYGNLIGDQLARISDDSTVADFDTDEDFDQTLSDFTTSTPGIMAFSADPATQVLTAEMAQQHTVVNGAGDPSATTPTTMTDSDPITWAKKAITVELQGDDNGAKDDVLTADAPKAAAGATVKLYKVKADGSLKLLKTSTLGSKGNHKFTVTDNNGKDKTKYQVKVLATDTTKKAEDTKSVR